MVIAVDIDGVLNAKPYPGLGPTLPGAVSAMRRLHEEGHILILWTCRAGEDLTAALNWCRDHEIPYDYVNRNDKGNIDAYHGSDTRKVHADLYIDDRQVGGFAGWEEVLRWVDCMEASNS